jgi:hypothetical protein
VRGERGRLASVSESSSLCPTSVRRQRPELSFTCEKSPPNDVKDPQREPLTMRSMQALVKRERGPGLWLEEIPIPPVGEFDVLIRVLRSSICGTDVHIYEWDSWAQRTIPTPMAIGHEFVGIIESVGSHVIDFQPGMIVTGEGHIVCGRCRNCLAGRRHLCNKTSGIGVNRPGAFSQFLSIPQTNVWLADQRFHWTCFPALIPLEMRFTRRSLLMCWAKMF